MSLAYTVTKLKDIGERNAIDYIFTLLERSPTIAIGPGDDCAAIPFNDSYLLLTTDMINAKTHIPPQMTPKQLGWFITAINLSDLAAKGGKPLGILLSYGLPRTTTKTYLHKLTLGANQCATKFHTTIIGGDLKETTEITLTGTAIGIIPKNQFMPRTGIKPGDIVAVTGNLGKAAAGYHSLKLQKKNTIAQQGFFKPIPRLKEGQILAKTGAIHSSMDISDGLSSSLYQLQKINHVGFKINKKNLPISPQLHTIAHKTPLDILQEALHFGGDYELLITLPKNQLTNVQEKFKTISTKLTPIGTATTNTQILLENQTTTTIENKGYEHFLTK
jgi:thiamine-monophosphate kinase